MGASQQSKEEDKEEARIEAGMENFVTLLRLALLCSFIVSQVDARSKHYLIETEDKKDETAEGETESFETATLNILEGEDFQGEPGDPLNPFQRSTALQWWLDKMCVFPSSLKIHLKFSQLYSVGASCHCPLPPQTTLFLSAVALGT